MTGTYAVDKTLRFSIHDTRTNTTHNMQSTGNPDPSRWYLGTHEPAFIMKDVQPDGQLGNTAVETVSRYEDFETLKMCLSRGSDLDMIVPLGLALAKHSANDFYTGD